MVPNVQDPFWRAVAAVRRLPPGNVDDNLKLEFYALFKQATKGDVVDARPTGFLDFAAKAKWDAWNGKKGMPPEAAKNAYVALMDAHVSGWDGS